MASRNEIVKSRKVNRVAIIAWWVMLSTHNAKTIHFFHKLKYLPLFQVACEQALREMEGERKEEGLYAPSKFTCPPLF